MTGFDWRLDGPRSNADLAYDRIRQAIVAGQFQPGQRITELGIAALLGVSRTPVREAFLRLTTDGLLRAGALGGIEVVDPRAEADDIHLLREAVEGCAARLAAQRATAAEIAEIRALAEATSRADPGELDTRARLNELFHLAIAAASHAPRVERLVRDYRSLFASAERLGKATTARLREEHLAIADAIAGQDSGLAEERMRAHLRDFRAEEKKVRRADFDAAALVSAAARRNSVVQSGQPDQRVSAGTVNRKGAKNV